MGKSFDCSGWATKANMRCADGRIIMKNAFKECDGMTVPVVWNHKTAGKLQPFFKCRMQNLWFSMETLIDFLYTPINSNSREVT